MTAHKKTPSRNSKILSIAFFAVAFVLFIMWLTVSWREGYSPAQKEAAYANMFPDWLSFTVVHILSLVCCILSISFASRSFRKKQVGWRFLLMLIVMFSIFIILFDIAQLI